MAVSGTVSSTSEGEFSKFMVQPKFTALDRLSHIRLNTTPKMSRIWSNATHHIGSSFANGIQYIEKISRPKSLTDEAYTLKLQKQRSLAMKIMVHFSNVTDLGAMGCAFGSIALPQLVIPAIALALTTLTLRLSSRVVSQVTLKTVQTEFTKVEFKQKDSLNKELKDKILDIQLSLQAVDLMKPAGVKYLKTSNGLMTRTDLALAAYKKSKDGVNESTPESDECKMYENLQKRSEQSLRRILAAKSEHREFQARLGLRKDIENEKKSSANIAVKGFGTVRPLLPIEENPDIPETKFRNVLSMLKGDEYGSQTSRPDLEKTLRNLVWRPENNQKDWTHLVNERKAIHSKISDYRQKMASNKEDASIVMPETGLIEKQQAWLKKNNLDEKQLTTDFLEKPIHQLVPEALKSLTPKDKAAFDKGQTESMSPAGRGLVYAVQSLIRNERSLKEPLAIEVDLHSVEGLEKAAARIYWAD